MEVIHFSKPDVLYNIGDKLYPVDLGSFMQHDTDSEWLDRFKADDARHKIRYEQKPLIVVNNIPYEHMWMGQTEYFIDVKFEGSDELFRIFNTKSLVYTDWSSYDDEMTDIEECAEFGY